MVASFLVVSWRVCFSAELSGSFQTFLRVRECIARSVGTNIASTSHTTLFTVKVVGSAMATQKGVFSPRSFFFVATRLKGFDTTLVSVIFAMKFGRFFAKSLDS